MGRPLDQRTSRDFSDNQTAIDIKQSGTYTDPLIMKIIWAIFFHAAKRNLNLILSYVPGKGNIDADLLSRFQIEQFLQRNPQADWS